MTSKEFDVVILTDRRYLKPDPSNNYVSNVLLEDRLVLEALEREGLKVKRLAWDDKNFDWNNTKTILFRSTWDYFDRFSEFSDWLKDVSKLTGLINSEKIIRWNTDKHYLQDLEQKGIHTIPTIYIEKNSNTTLRQLYKQTGWEKMILKPCISGGASDTFKLSSGNLDQHEDIFQNLILFKAMMLQPFVKNIVEKGEISLMIIGGKYSHAVLKKAKPGDFRVQDDWGGTVHDYIPTTEEIRFAEMAVKNCIEPPSYARTDMVTDNEGRLAIVELELIEPELWFRKHPKAAQNLAQTVKKLVK